MRVNHRRRPVTGNVVDHLAVALQVRRIHGAGHLVGHHALHQERHAEDIHALVDQDLDGGGVGEGVVGALRALLLREYTYIGRMLDRVILPPRQGCCFVQTLRRTHWIRTLDTYISISVVSRIWLFAHTLKRRRPLLDTLFLGWRGEGTPCGCQTADDSAELHVDKTIENIDYEEDLKESPSESEG